VKADRGAGGGRSRGGAKVDGIVRVAKTAAMLGTAPIHQPTNSPIPSTNQSNALTIRQNGDTLKLDKAGRLPYPGEGERLGHAVELLAGRKGGA